MARGRRWLTADEQTTWRSYLLTTQLVDEALDRQLQRDAGMPHVYYGILVALSESSDRTMRMSELARFLRYSQSRLTHAVNSLESKGWVRREQSDVDRRGQWAVLTEAGHAKLVESAPGHVAAVRDAVFDRLGAICDALLDGLDPAAERRHHDV
jgi:DNA-binding MarR family transcriptional regulator